MRMKNLMGVSEVRIKKKLDSFTLETSKNHLIRNFLRPKPNRPQAPDVPDLAQTVKLGSNHSENLANVFYGAENGNFI